MSHQTGNTQTAENPVQQIGDLVAANAERLAEIEVRDNGKLMAEMLGQLRYHPEWWWYFGGLVDKLEGGLVPIDKAETFAYTTHEPVGVVAALTAWNSPLLFVAWKCAAALAAGCAVIVKPSEFTSASTLEFAALTKEAGIPDGIFNVVTGFGPEIGTELISHPGVAKITFTGSDTTGAKVYETAARSLKRVSLELGGKSPNIVFEDADLNAAAAGAVSGIFAATGQTCIAGSRLLVQSSIKDKFVARLLELARSAKIGDPMQSDTNIGPITTPAQYKKVLDYIDVAKAEGARCLLGGKPAFVLLDLRPDPLTQLRILGGDGLRQAVADRRLLDEHRRPPGAAQPHEQVGVLEPDDQRWVEELTRAVTERGHGVAAHGKAPGGEVAAHGSVDGQREGDRRPRVDRRPQRLPPPRHGLDVVVHDNEVRRRRGAHRARGSLAT